MRETATSWLTWRRSLTRSMGATLVFATAAASPPLARSMRNFELLLRFELLPFD
jgi:hypothetical protein